ncbi:MAG TPA: Gfo/Idh/MocA family oxidoreductase [Limnochordia bacterium]
MERLRIGFIGTGKRPERPGPQGYGMAHQHAAAYRALADQCEIVACADIVPENARAFAELFDVGAVYTDHRTMLSRERLDMVSVCTWPKWHAPLVIDAAEAGVRAIHCEKPMADTWGAAQRMAQVCEERGVKLTFNHQRRFGLPFRKAKELLDAGAIGALQRIEFGVGNLYDYGSHSFDLCNFFNGEVDATWVIAQIDYRTQQLVFGAHNENQAFALWRYENGVFGCASTGPGAELIGCHHRLVGTDGVIEIGPRGERLPILRLRRGGGEWEAIDCAGEGLHGPGYIERAIADAVSALQTGGESQLCARNALRATELIFACWESARRRGRVDLPLRAEDNALEAMVAAGELSPA